MKTKLILQTFLTFFLSVFFFPEIVAFTIDADSTMHEARSADNKKMERKENNFTSFTVSKKEHLEEWKKFNKPEYYSHSDFGIDQPTAPCATCVEVLEKRTIDSKYYINYEKPSEFYIQKGIGEFFYKKDNEWVTIDDKLKPVSDGLYQSNYYLEPVGIDVNTKQSYILTESGKVYFNNWQLLSETNGVETPLDNANWSDYTVGDDGIYIKNIFKGIDAQMLIYRGAVKTNFVMKKNEYGDYGNLIFRDTYNAGKTTTVKYIEDENKTDGVGALFVSSGDKTLLQVKEAVMYPKGATKDKGQLAAYKLNRNSTDILVPYSWIKEYINNYELIIDPLVSGSATLAQAAILGSMYNASCTFTNFCSYNLTVAAPANATFTDVLWSFNYTAVAFTTCWLQDGACRFTRGGCISPNVAGFYWYCNLTGAGTCTGSNISIFSDVAACMPAPACAPQNVSFTMQFFRSCWGAAGCSNACIGAASPWTMTIQGHTLEYSNVPIPITISANPICQGQSVNVSTGGTYGVPGYTYNWSLFPGGAPSAGTGAATAISFPTQGAYTIYTFITDACGTTISTSVPLTVNQNVTTNANIDQTVCAGNSITLAGFVTGGAGTGTWSAPSGTFAPNATTLNATYTPTVASGTVTLTLTSLDPAGPCAATTDQMVVTVAPSVVPTFTAIGPLCLNSAPPALPASSTNLPAINGTWSPAVISTAAVGTIVYTFTPTAGQCATTTTMSITIVNQIVPTFNAIGPLCQNSVPPVLPTSSTNLPAITGTWNAAINTAAAGTIVYTFTPNAGQCAANATMNITVTAQITPTFAAIPNVCVSAVAPVLPLASTNLPAINGTWAPAVSTAVAGTTVYTFTPTAGQCATTTTLNITVDAPVTPTFAAIGPLCQNAVAPVLPISSTNLPAINGTWNAPINTAVIGATVYTFTPTAGQCATTSTMNITITNPIVPTFAAIPNVCQGSVAPVLPLASTNLPAINGTWAPAVSTAVAGTIIYTFTPTAGQCATTTTLNITVDPQITPTFAAIPNVCQGGVAPVLPLTSTNLPAINGTWAPAVSTAVAGTIVYTFTPTAGQCATTTTLNITVDPQITPTFAAIPNVCQGSVAPVLPLASTNLPAINGTWAPAVSTAVAGTIVYTFTPTAGQCATTTTLNITVDPQITPTFAAIPNVCQGSVAPVLPLTSTNLPAINGTWAPAVSTAVAGTTVYTFTPTAGQCATTTTLNITVDPQITPTFAAIPNVCQGSVAPVLPLASTNLPAINGTWAPVVSTAVAGTTVYTYTPTAGQCATTATLNITVDPQITPTFAAIPNVCQGSVAPVLPLASTNLPAINGTWAPAVSTAVAGTTVYTFTPTAGQCATTTTLNITVEPLITPTFAAIPNVCQGSVAPVLPLASTNLPAISGTWAPAVSTAVAGTTVYTFTPTAGQCATTTTLNITVDPLVTPTFTAIGQLCQNSVAPILPLNSNDLPVIAGTWNAPVSSTILGNTIYTFTPTAGQCATNTTMSINVTNQILPTFTAIPNICQGSAAQLLPASSTNLPAINGTWAPAVINTAAAGTVVYTFTPTAGQCAINSTVNITVDALVTPTFTAVPNVCQNSVAPVLPLSSTNLPAINGTWNPVVITAVAATTVYTFTPTAGQCANTTTLNITVDPEITPTFAAIPNVCQGSVAPVLPLASTNLPAISGTWAPAVSTATAGTTTYTFTPTVGTCASTTNLNITVDQLVTPTFTAIGQLCQNSVAPFLPLNSNDLPAINGTWNAAISTTVLGNTVYTFTPTAGQCATTTTMNVNITNQITPTFNAIANICLGGVAPVLPASSTNLPVITGSWLPAAISTAAIGTTVYTFTPNAGQCAIPSTLNVTIDAQVTPTFTQIGPLCQNSVAPVLPTSSNDLPAIIGTWNAAISTTTLGNTVYTFTPTAGQCASTTTMIVNISTQILPTFTAIPNICQGSIAPALPLASTNLSAINGTWNAAINTAIAGTTVYTFTPTAGQCAIPVTLNVTVDALVTPTFAAIGPLCQNSAPPVMPLFSTNLPAITGTWSPAISTTTSGTTVYTFTPTAGQCATTATMNITVNPTPVSTINYSQLSYCISNTNMQNVVQTGTAGGTYSSNPAGLNINTSTGTIIPNQSTAGVYTVTYTIPASGSCPPLLTATNVNIAPLPVISFTASPQAGCVPLCVTFTDSSPVNSGLATWSWNFGDGTPNDITQNPPFHCYNTTGIYSVSLTGTSAAGCSATINSANLITVMPIPVANFSAPLTTSIETPTVHFTDLSSAATSWFWDFGDFSNPTTDTSHSQRPSHTYSAEGTYCVTLAVSNGGVCFDTTQICFDIAGIYTFYIPNAFTPNDDGTNDFFFGEGTNILDFEMYIYDRWGMQVFYSNDIKKAWNGGINRSTEVAQEDVYVYKVNIKDNLKQDHVYIGNVTLVK